MPQVRQNAGIACTLVVDESEDGGFGFGTPISQNQFDEVAGNH